MANPQRPGGPALRLTAALWLLALLLLVIAIGLGATEPRRPAPSRARVDLEKIAARDPRIEIVARAVMASRGINPDYEGFPYPPGPVWETYILQGRDFLAAFDAAARLTPAKAKP